jgi:hypothetical protein
MLSRTPHSGGSYHESIQEDLIMKARTLIYLLVGCVVVLAAWLVHTPRSVQADEVPEKYRDMVSKGLEYLVKHQHKDGHWEGDDGKHPVAMTGLVGLALLVEGNRDYLEGRGRTVSERKYKAEIRKAADWLLDNARPDGLIYSGHPSETARYMQGHGLATLFLAGTLREESDGARIKKTYEVLSRAVEYIGKAQSTQGGWYYTSRVEGHDLDAFSASIIQVQALQAAEMAGTIPLRIPLSDGQQYLKNTVRKYDAAKPGQDIGRQVDTAAVLACQIRGAMGKLMDTDESCKKWLKYCKAEIPVGGKMKFARDELTHYYFAQVMFNLGGDDWKNYRTAMFDHLQSQQNKDGSWPGPTADGGIGVGPVFATALWCTVLQLDKKSHPSMRWPEDFMPITSTSIGPEPWLKPNRSGKVGIVHQRFA